MDEIQQNTDEAMKEMHDKLKLAAEYYHLTFGTDTGKVVLSHLKEMTAGSTLSGNDMIDVSVNINPSDLVFMREGQNQVVRYITKMIKFYGDNK